MGERVDALFFRARSTVTDTDCWEWGGSKLAGGYGRVYDPIKRGAGLAHRVSLAVKLGRGIRPGLFACHTCDNKLCVNPAHLYEGTRQDNSNDMTSKGRQQRGERHFMAKTRDHEVALIKYLAACGVMQASLGALWGLPSSSISQMVTGRTWKHVEPLEGPHD